MHPTRRQILGLTGALCAIAVPIASLKAQGSGWPNKPIGIIVPGGPGGVTDIRARWLGERLGPALGQLIVVENRPGAGGNLGTAAAARSAPDGYTLVIVHIGTMAINPHLYASPGYHSLTDLAPITRLGVGPQVLAVHTDLPAMDEAGVPGYDFTAWAGIAAPAGTPEPIIKQLYAAIARILATPEARMVRVVRGRARRRAAR